MNLLKDAVEKFGTTEECKSRTFILPDGRMLDFTTKFCLTHFEYNCHDAVAKKVIGESYGRPANKFIRKTGAIRMSNQPDAIYVQLGIENPLTKKQIETIERCACFNKSKEIVYDITKGNKIIRASGTFNIPDCFKGVDKLKKDFALYHRRENIS